MKLNFQRVAILIALSFFTLAATLMFAPNVMLADWGLELTLSVSVVCRRAAALFAGIAVMFFLARNAEPSPARSALTTGLVVSCLMLTALGGFELAAGHVTPKILIPMSIEVMFTLALLRVGHRQ
ncbi:hypothetical protein SAMN05216303_102138 [Rhodoferax sp. OV413]|uniref:hypothetical protein n=1 Tax=Rhodoferax sp. OV413 TaxID=1855285 RepID=UPI0008905906|nr:hypothetical protein [Rhodoferax sp. OV413]SDO70476.1 hypothetical protein SAMN05216303_102138 [Rhodoferax sp. OV413]